MTNVLLEIFFANKDTSVVLAVHSRSSDPHMMSLNIDMKIIRPWNCDVMNSWTLSTNCNVENPGQIFHSTSIGSASIVSKVVYFGQSVNQLKFSSQTVFGVGF